MADLEDPLTDTSAVASLEAFLEAVCPAMLGLSQPERFGASLAAGVEALASFTAGSTSRVLFVRCCAAPPDGAHGAAAAEGEHVTFSGVVDGCAAAQRGASLALIKRQPAALDQRPMAAQLQLVSLGDGEQAVAVAAAGAGATTDAATASNAVGLLHGYVQHSFVPLLASLSAAAEAEAAAAGGSGGGGGGGGGRRADKSGLAGVAKKVKELELALSQCRQNVDVPEVNLRALVNPVIEEACNRHRESGATKIDLDALGLADRLADDAFLNSIQRDTGRWLVELKKVTLLSREVSSSAVDEVRYWDNHEQALKKVEAQLDGEEVKLTLLVLERARRFGAKTTFEADHNLKPAMQRVSNAMVLMRDFPINPLLAASSVEQLMAAVEAIFKHLAKAKSAESYEPSRLLRLLEAISRDLSEQVCSVLSSSSALSSQAAGGHAQQLMRLLYPEFERATKRLPELFKLWDKLLAECAAMIKKLARDRRVECSISINWQHELQHELLRQRLHELGDFRRKHEQLRDVIERVLVVAVSGGEKGAAVATEAAGGGGGSGGNADAAEVSEAFKHFTVIDVLDTSAEGTAAWHATLDAYEQCIERVESRIARRLTDRLAATHSADEMFSVFSQFNALFFRPRIRGAIQQFQMRLIETVKLDVAKLQEKFRRRYQHSEAQNMSGVRDLPPISGAIIWAHQIERQLAGYMQRISTVLGEDWKEHAEGKKLKEIGDAFMRKLDTKQLFRDWCEGVKTRGQAAGGVDSELTGALFSVTQAAKAKDRLQLRVAFNPEIITLFKEVRNLEWLGRQLGPSFRTPFAIKMKADEVKDKYPFAMSLRAALRTYHQACAKEEGTPSIAVLSASYKRAVHAHVQQAFEKPRIIRWEAVDSDRGLSSYVRELATKVSAFNDCVDDLLAKHAAVRKHLAQLAEEAPYKGAALLAPLSAVQKIVDEMNLAEYLNLGSWVAELNAEVEGMLAERLQGALTDWTDAFRQQQTRGDRDDDEQQEPDEMKAGDTPASPSKSARQENTVHHILLRNQVMYLQPPLEQARATWVGQLHRCLDVACDLPRLVATRYDQGFSVGNVSGQGDPAEAEDASFRRVLHRLPAGMLAAAFSAIEGQLLDVTQYVATWLQYQSLWDMQLSAVADKLGENVPRWLQLLQEIKSERQTFDTSESSKRFGPIVINFSSVQAKVNTKYDVWHREMLSQFGVLLASLMASTLSEISAQREKLETLSLESPDTDTVVDAITLVQSLGRLAPKWQENVERLVSGERLLKKQRFAFPNDWLGVEQLEGEWTALQQIRGRKSELMDSRMDALQLQIKSEARAVDERSKELLANWGANKPLQGSIAPQEAMDALRLFQASIGRVQEKQDRITKAKDALRLPPSDAGAGSGRALEGMRAELVGLLEVWEAMAGVSAAMLEIAETPWSAVVVRKVRKAIDVMLADMKSMNNRVRQYEAFKFVQEQVQSHRATLTLVSDLRSDALKDRHWKEILGHKILAIATPFADLNLGVLWDAELARHEPAVRDVVRTAQGEMALEEFLHQVRETWTGYELELANFQSKCRLIRGWGEIFDKLDDNLNSLASMAHSPFYQVFAETAATWTERLTALRVILDIWIDVQRKWVYLQGIFFGSADIKQQLPKEYGRFKTIDTEFTTLMRKVSYKPQILDVAALPNLQRQLERQDDLLNKIQKALGEYLEQQRRNFSRFYFVGDEDLLDIIGSGGDPLKLQRHLSKMFAGITAFDINEGKTLQAMVSREGESVSLSAPITVAADQRVDMWLTAAERGMRQTLATLLECATQALSVLGTDLQNDSYFAWLEPLPTQIATLSALVGWSTDVETALAGSAGALSTGPLQQLQGVLRLLADRVLVDLASDQRKKCEQLITVIVHKRDVTRKLLKDGIGDAADFAWLYYMRFYYHPNEPELQQRLSIKMADASFFYGFEYLGVGERLVTTPLTDRCFLTLTQALQLRMGGNPFGPAGTGKTESVKALGAELGRFVLVFNCDENFDFQAMGRLFVGLCQVGAWGCFDEFNRLEERILSAVSQQILTIQQGLASQVSHIELIGKSTRLDSAVGIFVTMNLGYAGRSILPDNLKQLFRPIAMVAPDRELIAQVMLFSQGIVGAESLAGKVVLLFNLCGDQLSSQPHYDFGLRALKSVLVSAGNLKRREMELAEVGDAAISDEQLIDIERDVLIQSTCDTVVPKLVEADLSVFDTLLAGVFPGVTLQKIQAEKLREHIVAICAERHLQATDTWVEKALQIFQVQQHRHGVMMVGPSGTGKSAVWHVLLQAMERLDGVKGESYVIDPKAISKDALFGTLDPTTAEWTDGIFTHVLRQIINNVRGESTRRHWLVFDGDVDPEWAENLNSVLDDNKLLTLPSGERLQLPSNVRVMMETETLRYATLATVSRCGMVWFNDNLITTAMLIQHKLAVLRGAPLTSMAEEGGNEAMREAVASAQQRFVDVIEPLFADDGVVDQALSFSMAEAETHVMPPSKGRLLMSLFALLEKGIAMLVEYDEGHPDFPMADDHLERFASRWLLFSLLWGFAGSMSLEQRKAFGTHITGMANVTMPDDGSALIDLEAHLQSGEWQRWEKCVPQRELESHKCVAADVVVTTVDTVRHVEVLRSWLSSHMPFILCGPPGSGKTLTLTSTMLAMPELELVNLNFSSGTTPDLILKTFSQYCEYKRTPDGVLLQPSQVGKWLVVFCDEVNLPATDKYGTQHVIQFLRQLSEQGGFWRPSDCAWVKLKCVQFVFACNPPTDPGRVAMSERFLCHTPLLLVDYPARESLVQIYGTFNRALLKLQPHLRSSVDPLTAAMVDMYTANTERFSADVQPQYVYSPRELSRWVRAMYEAIAPLDQLEIEGLVRLWAHEGLRLFRDRLTEEVEREWCDARVDAIAKEHFPSLQIAEVLVRPILFSNWLTKNYISVGQMELRQHVEARLRVFYEEELNVKLVVFDSVLEHVLRIDRVLRQPLGHLLLAGESGTGKTVLSRFVAWMNGLSVFQVKVTRRYTVENFDDDLRALLKRAGCGGEKIAFIFDESNALSSAFLERMNALLASGDVPGLFEDEEYGILMSACREAAQRDGIILDTEEELFRRFTHEVQNNLHIIFTMNPAGSDLQNRQATSPALFNRCVVDWFGSWSQLALVQVALEFTATVDLPEGSCDVAQAGSSELLDLAKRVDGVAEEALPSMHSTVASSIVQMHNDAHALTQRLSHMDVVMYLSPRDYLDLIHHYTSVFAEKRQKLEDQQLHLNIGLSKLHQTADQVAEMQGSLGSKDAELKEKEAQAERKLAEMVGQQSEAEAKKGEAEKLSAELAIQDAHIAEQRAKAESDLAEAEPALLEAQSSVRSIKKAQLDEVRALARPPPLVRKTMEAVACMLGESAKDWTEIRRIIRKDDFIERIITFESDRLTRKQRANINDNFLSNADFNFEKVNRSSTACGPLFKWVESQVSYCEILVRVAPLREQVATLQAESESLRQRAIELNATVASLEASIAVYKDEYGALINETQAIKTEKQQVQTMVERSTSLLSNLGQERTRWEESSASFQEQMTTLPGDSLLSAAFLAYLGFFAAHHRVTLGAGWRAQLEASGIKFKLDLSITDYLSAPAERLTWQSHGLPVDDLCTENAIILQRFRRYPLIIDPAGHAIAFLKKQYAQQKVTTASFLDSSFLKLLASALRFGTPLVVQDVGSIDPILNPLLNKEFHKTGGRVLIRLGDEDIDFSPSFQMFMTTRDPSCQFSPDLCSRVTFVNFTVTPSSLQSQCLSTVLSFERPDINEQRVKLSKLQGEFQARLRELENKLLAELAAVQGAILDDDKVINALELLQREAAEVAEESAKTDSFMAETVEASALYLPLAEGSSNLYFALKELPRLHFLYRLPLRFLTDMLEIVLRDTPTAEEQKPEARVAELRAALFALVAKRVSRGLLQKDKLLFALRMAQVYVGESSTAVPAAQMELLLNGMENCVAAEAHAHHKVVAATFTGIAPPLTPQQQGQLEALCALPAFDGLPRHLGEQAEAWRAWVQEAEPEACVPAGWAEEGAGGATGAALRAMLLLRVLRPDRLLVAGAIFVRSVFGEHFEWDSEFELGEVVRAESASSRPLLLCSQPGHDASAKVDRLAADSGVKYRSVAMGSAEGFVTADKCINSAMGDGSWVMLRNVHLCVGWLVELEKRLHSRKPHPNFRLLLTSELHPGLPVSLLRASDVIVFEPPSGIKASMLRTLAAVPEAMMNRAPAERGRLHLLLAWFHAVVQERLRYAPVGWAKTYEFNDADQRCAMHAIDSWVDMAGEGRAHIAPDDIPWQALRTLIGESIYGGRIDNAFDSALLRNLVAHLFVPQCFDADFALATACVPNDATGALKAVSVVKIPDGSDKGHFMQWVKQLPSSNPPSWLGLSRNAETLMLRNGGLRLVRMLAQMQDREDRDEAVAGSAAPGLGAPASAQLSGAEGATETAQVPMWMRKLQEQVRSWRQTLPKALAPAAQDAASVLNPLFRWLAREAKLAAMLLEQVHAQLVAVDAVCSGAAKATNTQRDLMSALSKGVVPADWRRFFHVADVTVGVWLADFGKRVTQLQDLCACGVQQLRRRGVWLGGLFSPEAFVTATRQAVAQQLRCGLESLRMVVTIGEQGAGDATFIIKDLIMEGAKWDSGAVSLCEDLRTVLPVTCFHWVHVDAKHEGESDHTVALPVYLNEARQDLLFTIHVAAERGIALSAWEQRAVAVVAWTV